MAPPSESERLQSELADALHQPLTATWATKAASTYTLETAMGILQAQIASRRQIMGLLEVGAPEFDATAREIQDRVDRIRQIVAELRRRGEEVEWEE